MSKEDTIIQTVFKVSNRTKGEALIYNVLAKCENKTDLIKNALFHYIVNIQNGFTIDRAFPYDEIDKYTSLEKEKVVYVNNQSYGQISHTNDNQYELENEDDIYNNDELDNSDDNEYDEEYEEYEDNNYEDDNMDLL